MAKRRVLVTGAAGQLGGVICGEFSDDELIPLTHADLELTDHRAVIKTVAKHEPSIVINCAAYNKVDDAEHDSETALAVNAFGVRSLARVATEVGATFVHYSSDFVFDGEATDPYTEEDTPNPRSVYGASKLLGEWFAADAPKAYVLRVESLFGGSPPQSSVDRIIDAVVNGREAKVFSDRVVSPSYVVDVAAATRSLLESQAAPGTYHCVNAGHVTWLGLAEEIVRRINNPAATLRPVSVATVSLPAARPFFCALSNAKLSAAGAGMPSWQDGLGRHLRSRGSTA